MHADVPPMIDIDLCTKLFCRERGAHAHSKRPSIWHYMHVGHIRPYAHGFSWIFIHFYGPGATTPVEPVEHAMDSGDLTTGRYLYWEESVQRSFEIVHQESQSQLIFSQVLDGVAASGVLKRIDSQRWEASCLILTV